ncbi:zinc-finger homeodomain protein 6-like [Cynara cardunculus var. scolymus]|uniref:Homeodomain-containing protein n=1 Tax=Cynara cardunculus var. scolymus TaxID=59895 RepID=A0A103XKG9_CYNCS|nr:zinc-finger homeodomain protein 6-like [Cynara cardunculus var. scolymus]KVH92359.1 Homeodomain-containing protein [Cynara cardunculus var. scolymus]
MEVRERETISHNNPPQSNQESSSMFSYGTLNSSRNETPDQLRLHLHQRNNIHGLELQEQQMEAHRRRTESNPDPDPVSQTLPPPQPSATESAAVAVVVRYRECLKNHAASMGSHVVDGCGEFMANGEEGTPEGLKCAACECHRSFHRREVEGESQSTTTTRIHNSPPRVAAMQPIPASLPYQQHHRYHHQMPPFMVAFGGGNSVAPTESSSEDLDAFQTHAGGHMMMEQPSKKRFRTKFTEEQKEKMRDFAERIGWKIQKQDEQEIQQFCNEVGLKRQVFKVWMHNSKQAMKKKQV